MFVDKLTGKQHTMGIIDAIKKIEREEGKIEGLKEGKIEGKIEGKSEVIENLLIVGKFTVSEIANFANVPESFVRKIKNKLKK